MNWSKDNPKEEKPAKQNLVSDEKPMFSWLSTVSRPRAEVSNKGDKEDPGKKFKESSKSRHARKTNKENQLALSTISPTGDNSTLKNKSKIGKILFALSFTVVVPFFFLGVNPLKEIIVNRLDKPFILSTESQERVSGIDTLAELVTVKVSSDEERGIEGSGTLLECDRQLCKVVTNSHVLKGLEKLSILTHDGKWHEANVVADYSKYFSDDLALLTFSTSSSTEYTGVTFGDSSKLKDGEDVLAVGFPFGADKPVKKAGEFSFSLPKPLEDGYRIAYSIDIEQGMSGGPLLNKEGELVGINGKRSHPIMIFDEPLYAYQDGSGIVDRPVEELNSYSWAIPVSTLRSRM